MAEPALPPINLDLSRGDQLNMIACGICKALTMRDDAKAHHDWHLRTADDE